MIMSNTSSISRVEKVNEPGGCRGKHLKYFLAIFIYHIQFGLILNNSI